METITLTKVFRKEKTSKSGKPYTSLGLKCIEHGDVWISGFGNKDNRDWKEGDKVQVIIEQKGEYKNFSMPTQSKNSASEAILHRLEMAVGKLEAFVARLESGKTGGTSPESGWDGIPF